MLLVVFNKGIRVIRGGMGLNLIPIKNDFGMCATFSAYHAYMTSINFVNLLLDYADSISITEYDHYIDDVIKSKIIPYLLDKNRSDEKLPQAISLAYAIICILSKYEKRDVFYKFLFNQCIVMQELRNIGKGIPSNISSYSLYNNDLLKFTSVELHEGHDLLSESYKEDIQKILDNYNSMNGLCINMHLPIKYSISKDKYKVMEKNLYSCYKYGNITWVPTAMTFSVDANYNEEIQLQKSQNMPFSMKRWGNHTMCYDIFNMKLWSDDINTSIQFRNLFDFKYASPSINYVKQIQQAYNRINIIIDYVTYFPLKDIDTYDLFNDGKDIYEELAIPANNATILPRETDEKKNVKIITPTYNGTLYNAVRSFNLINYNILKQFKELHENDEKYKKFPHKLLMDICNKNINQLYEALNDRNININNPFTYYEVWSIQT